MPYLDWTMYNANTKQVANTKLTLWYLGLHPSLPVVCSTTVKHHTQLHKGAILTWGKKKMVCTRHNFHGLTQIKFHILLNMQQYWKKRWIPCTAKPCGQNKNTTRPWCVKTISPLYVYTTKLSGLSHVPRGFCFDVSAWDHNLEDVSMRKHKRRRECIGGWQVVWQDVWRHAWQLNMKQV